MLTRVEVRNLACFSEVPNSIEPAPETVIIGPNNVGKSALIAGLNALHAFCHFGAWQWNYGRAYNWNNFDDIVHRHELGREIYISATIQGMHWSGTLSTIVRRDQGPTLNIQRAPNIIEELGKIWYLGPSRTELQHQMQIGASGAYLPWQPINPDGSNVITYLLERFTSRDPQWGEAEDWLKHISPELSVLKVPLRVMQASVETTDSNLGVDINMAYQGTGIQKALSVIAALVFSPKGSTIIIEEPEIHLHPRSQEVIVDLFNKAVTEWDKQVVFVTHSWDMLLPFVSDVGKGQKRGAQHPKADPSKFKLIAFSRLAKDKSESIKISELDIKNMDFMTLRDYLKKLWG